MADGPARFRFSSGCKEWWGMKKAYRYRLYLTKKQETILNQQLALCCELVRRVGVRLIPF